MSAERTVGRPQVHCNSNRWRLLTDREVAWTFNRAICDPVADSLFGQADENHLLERISEKRDVPRKLQIAVALTRFCKRSERKVIVLFADGFRVYRHLALEASVPVLDRRASAA